MVEEAEEIIMPVFEFKCINVDCGRVEEILMSREDRDLIIGEKQPFPVCPLCGILMNPKMSVSSFVMKKEITGKL